MQLSWHSAPVSSESLGGLMSKLAAGETIKSRLEPKKKPGEFRELWIPTDEGYQFVLEVLSTIIGNFSTSPEALAFRKKLSPLKGLRGMIDEYEFACDNAGLPKTQTAHSEGHIIGTCYQGDIKNYYGTVKYDQVKAFLRTRLAQMLGTVCSEDECRELADVIADLTCPGEVLPQGFATSPAIANGVGVPLDKGIRRGVRAVLGDSRVSVVGRYADDLIVMTSGGYHDRILKIVSGVLDQHGFKLHPAKTRVTRAAENAERKLDSTREDSGGDERRPPSSRIHMLGVEMRNDGDGPLGFQPPATYVHEIRKALRFLLDTDTGNVEEKHVERVRGGLTYLHDILYWGLPRGAQLRKGQTCLLPREIENLWKQLRAKLKDSMTHRQRLACNLQSDEIERQTSKRELTLDQTLKELFGFDFEIKEDTGRGGGGNCVVSSTDEAGVKTVLLELNKKALLESGFPKDPEDIESFLLTAETDLRGRIEDCCAAKEAGKQPETQSSPEELEGMRRSILMEFLKWHLVTLLNVPGLKKDDFGELVDTDEIALDNGKKRPVPLRGKRQTILPWGLPKLLEETRGLWAIHLEHAAFDAPIRTEKIDLGATFTARKKHVRRNGKGGYLELPGFGGLRTASGMPIEEKAKDDPEPDDDNADSDGDDPDTDTGDDSSVDDSFERTKPN